MDHGTGLALGAVSLLAVIGAVRGSRALPRLTKGRIYRVRTDEGDVIEAAYVGDVETSMSLRGAHAHEFRVGMPFGGYDRILVWYGDEDRIEPLQGGARNCGCFNQKDRYVLVQNILGALGASGADLRDAEAQLQELEVEELAMLEIRVTLTTEILDLMGYTTNAEREGGEEQLADLTIAELDEVKALLRAKR